MDRVLQLGAQLQVDAVLMCDLYAGGADPPFATYSAFLFNIRSGEKSVAKANTDSFEGEGIELFKKMVNEVLSQFN